MHTQPLSQLLCRIKMCGLALAVGLSAAVLLLLVAGSPPRVAWAADVVVNPGDSIQTAINSASPGDTILIQAGTYTESLTLNKPVSLTGVSSATVVVNAVADQRVLTVTGSAISNTVVISGLTFANGFVTGTATCPDSCGGGILITGTAQPLIQNVMIANNVAGYHGGGLYVHPGSPLTLTNVAVLSNTAMATGGGFYVLGPAIFVNAQVTSNTANNSGGAYVNGATTLLGGRFERNRAVGDAVGGLFAGSLTLTDTEFLSNTAQNGGGGAYAGVAVLTGGRFVNNRSLNNRGGGLVANGALTLTGTRFISNYADIDAGGVYALSAAQLNAAWFENNRTNGTGGALRAEAALSITGTHFISNTAAGNGGGLFHVGSGASRVVNSLFARNSAGVNGAALYLNSPGNVQILHTTIASIGLNPKQAIAVFSGNVGITNTIIVSHTIGISRTAGTAFEDYNLFFSNTANLSGTVITGSHSLAGSPAFLATASNDYHLGFGSAAIDTGTDAGVTSDFEGQARPQGGGFDIGYDEAPPTTPITLYLPLVIRALSTGESYYAGSATQWDLDSPVRPAYNHADKNLALRSYLDVTGQGGYTPGLVSYGPSTDLNGPQLPYLFNPPRVPASFRFYRVYNWNWGTPPDPGTRGDPITDYAITALGLPTTPGEFTHLPRTFNNNPINSVPYATHAMVMYADSSNIAVKYTREDSAATGYTLHIRNIAVDATLLALYNQVANDYNPNSPRNTFVGRGSTHYNLPFVAAGQKIGVALGTEIVVAVVDTGAYLDPRSCNDWWINFATGCPSFPLGAVR